MKEETRIKELCERELLKILEPGDTIYTIVKHTSRAGLYRVISLVVIKDNSPLVIDSLASRLLYGYDDKHGGCKVRGVGMDMGFKLVSALSEKLYDSPYAFQHKWLS